MQSTTPRPEMLLWLSDARGAYIPRDFANSFSDPKTHVFGVSTEDWQTLEAGPTPENEWYWEAWENVLNDCFIVDDKGVKYRVHQDGDCWLVPEGMEWDERNETYAWPETEAAE